MDTRIFLPGTDKQLEFLLENVDVKGFSILIIGTGCEEISKRLFAKGVSKVIIIVEDNDSLLNSRLRLANSNISVRLMEFENTDFKDSEFDLVFAQASVSNKKRNKITKEVFRLLKADGYFCVGEITSPTKSPPQFINDLWQSSGITPLHPKDQEQFYKERNFEIVKSRELSHTLKDFYLTSLNLLEENINNLTEQEKSYYKKLLNKISHESNAYLKLGGDAHIGFYAFILRKGQP
jgi:ubiquinone/menaquinone biosynthesis C-methylase UbiE